MGETYPEATISLSVPDWVWVRVIPYLDTAITELLENAVVHADTPTPSVEVTVEGTAETVTIRIVSTEPPLPEPEQAVLQGEGEGGPLYHGSGMGLGLVNWIVTYSDGTVRYASNDPQGNIIELRLPAAPLDSVE